jgi:hypothetical protein
MIVNVKLKSTANVVETSTRMPLLGISHLVFDDASFHMTITRRLELAPAESTMACDAETHLL